MKTKEQIEEWRDIPEFKGKYQASNKGRIRSLDREEKRLGHIYRVKGRVMSQSVNPNGYRVARMSLNSVVRHKSVHRLIMLAFCENPDNKPSVNHINSDRQDNRLENLEWCTNQENSNHMKQSNRSLKGHLNHQSKLDIYKILTIRTIGGHSLWPSRKIGSALGVSKTSVINVLKGASWANV